MTAPVAGGDEDQEARHGGDPLDELQNLPADPPLDEVEALLRSFAANLRGKDRLRSGIAREKALRALAGKVNAPAKLVDEALQQGPGNHDEDELQGTPLEWEEPEPWPQRVDGGELLEGIAGIFTRYMVLPPGAPTTLALWVVFAHAHDAAEISPLLALCSPEKRCGKTRALSILAALVPRPLPTSNVTPAAVFRAIERFSPTLLVDEADTFLDVRHELRGILNSGHTRSGAYVLRTVGEDYEPRRFGTWAPKALAKIGRLPSTLEDRSILVMLQRKSAGEAVERLRLTHLEGEAKPLRRMVVRWTRNHLRALREADPDMPPELQDRAADNWRPLLAIADLAGGGWPDEARHAARGLSAGAAAEDSSVAIQLLADIRVQFLQSGEERLYTDELIRGLSRQEDRPWREWDRNGRPISPATVARLLREFGVRPEQFRRGEENRKGYFRARFEEPFRRYLPSLGETTETTEA